LKSVVDNSTEEKIDFTVTTGVQIKDHEELHLTDVMYTNNMVLFDQNNRLKRYETVGQILREFCEERLDLYGIRKAGVLNAMKRELDLLSFKIKFIGEVLSGSIDLRGKDEGALSSELMAKGYKKFDEGYDYLLNIQVRSMTAKRVQSLTEEHKELQAAVKAYEGKKPADIWREELKKLLAEWKATFAN